MLFVFRLWLSKTHVMVVGTQNQRLNGKRFERYTAAAACVGEAGKE